MVKTVHKGQVALVMVLIMTVVSAVVVSVAGRTTEETKMQRLSKDSADAFLTAQTGLEDAISKQAGVSGDVGADKSYVVILENKGQEGVLTEKIEAGTSVDVVLSASPLLEAVKIYWKSTSGLPSAISVSKFSPDLITEVAFDTQGLNGFSQVSSGGVLSGTSFPYVTPQISLDSSVTRIRITVLGESSFLGIEPIGDVLPVQTVSFKSEANVGVGNEKVKYGLQYEESKNAKIPEVFDYALFSFGSIIQ